MQCPICQCDDAYIGFTQVWCVNENCQNFNKKHADSFKIPVLDEDDDAEEYGEEYLWNIYRTIRGSD